MSTESNRTLVSVAEEVSLGTLLAAPVFEPLRILSTGLKYSLQTVQSNELRSDRQIPDLIRVGFESGGPIPMEFSFGSLDHIIRGVFQNEWQVATVRDNSYIASQVASVAVTTNVYTVVTNANNYRANSGRFYVGHLVRCTGFTSTNNNGLRNCTAATATTATLIAISGGGTTVAEAAPPVTARMKAVGVYAPATAGISVTTSGLGTGAVVAITNTGIDFINVGFVPGMWFKASGFIGTVANNGWYRALTVAATRIECDIAPVGFATDAGTGIQATLYFGDYLRNGTTKKSFLIEQQYQDLGTPEFEYYLGQVPARWNLSGDSNALVQTTVEFAGLNAVGPATARSASSTGYTGSATDRTAPTGDVYNTSSNVGEILENGTRIAGPNFCLQTELSIDNSIRRLPAIGSLPAVDIGTGRCVVKGSMQLYYGSNAVLARIRAATASSYVLRLLDPNLTRGYIMDIPRIKFEDGSLDIPGVDTDRKLTTPFMGLLHPTLGYTIQLQRIEEFA